MTAWALWRLAKFAALIALAGGSAGVLARPARADRLRLVYGLVLPAFLATWIAGYALMHHTGRGLEGWILAGMAASLTSLHLVLLAAHLARPKRATGALAIGALAAAVAEMALRPSAGAAHVLPLAIGLLATAAGSALPPPAGEAGPEDREILLRMLRRTVRIEGASLLLLLALSAGRRALGVELGWAPALLGWAHGVGVLIWLQVLSVGGRALGWSAADRLSGLSALLPFGAPLWERRGPLRSPPPDRGPPAPAGAAAGGGG